MNRGQPYGIRERVNFKKIISELLAKFENGASMFKLIYNFFNYWYFRYLLITELYMVEKWERHMFQMSLLSRQEINLRRLLAKCELLLKSQKTDERFPKYINSLEEMLLEVKKLIEPSNNTIKNYQKRIIALKTELGIAIDETESYQNMREDLLNIRHRNVIKTPVSDDLDHLINHNDNIQQKVTEDILSLTKSLKEQSQLANKIIKKDTEVLTRSSVLTDQNKVKLEVESSRLEEHSRRAWKCWMWIMLLMVMVVFFTMVMFIKVTKKKY